MGGALDTEAFPHEPNNNVKYIANTIICQCLLISNHNISILYT